MTIEDGETAAAAQAGRAGGKAGGPVRRTLRNAGWLLGGKGVGGVFSLIYLALAARALGLQGFGEFALILSFGQAVAMLAQFQTAEVMIRYGAAPLAERRLDRLSSVLGFSAALDALSAIGCMILSAAAVFLLGDFFGLDDGDKRRAALFGASFLVSIRGAPIGVLRLLDRFDIAALAETALPVSRLLAAILCWFLAPTVDAFLAAWAIAELLATVALWLAALRTLKKRYPDFRPTRPRLNLPAADYPDIWRFAWFTNLGASVAFLWQHAGTLAVGWQAGPAAAGGFRIAMQLAQSLSKPVVSLSRAAFPELTDVALRKGGRAAARLAGKLSIVAGAAGLAATAIVALFGKALITLIAGADFAFASDLLLLLTIAAAIEFWGFAQEPALLAMGRAGTVLAARAGIGLLYLALLIGLLAQFGPIGAAWAAVIGRLVYRAAMTALLARA